MLYIGTMLLIDGSEGIENGSDQKSDNLLERIEKDGYGTFVQEYTHTGEPVPVELTEGYATTKLSLEPRYQDSVVVLAYDPARVQVKERIMAVGTGMEEDERYVNEGWQKISSLKDAKKLFERRVFVKRVEPAPTE